MFEISFPQSNDHRSTVTNILWWFLWISFTVQVYVAIAMIIHRVDCKKGTLATFLTIKCVSYFTIWFTSMNQVLIWSWSSHLTRNILRKWDIVFLNPFCYLVSHIFKRFFINMFQLNGFFNQRPRHPLNRFTLLMI
jgi:hypothetical protein